MTEIILPCYAGASMSAMMVKQAKYWAERGVQVYFIDIEAAPDPKWAELIKKGLDENPRKG